MREVRILEIKRDDAGRLLVIPGIDVSDDLEQIDGVSSGFAWDKTLGALRSPELDADPWSYANWFRQTLLAVASECRIVLQLGPDTLWSVSTDARIPIERRHEEVRRAIAPAPPDEIGSTRTDTGVVRWWRPTKGYGAISVASTAPWDVWFHFSNIAREGYRSAEPGERVEVTFMRMDQETFKYVAMRVRRV